MKITKRERSFLRNFVIYRYRIEEWGKGRYYWDGDTSMRVNVGPTCEQLIDKGFLERFTTHSFEKIRAREIAFKFKCEAEGCQDGVLYDDGDNEALVLSECPHCDGTGLVLEI